MTTYIVVDCEAPFGVGSPAVGDMTEFGAIELIGRTSFHGRDCSAATFVAFRDWLGHFGGRVVFVSDNPAYDWQWINFYFWKYQGGNPFGHSARRIGDFYAGLTGQWNNANRWKHLRETPHDHTPVNDAMGNAEALSKMIGGKR